MQTLRRCRRGVNGLRPDGAYLGQLPVAHPDDDLPGSDRSRDSRGDADQYVRGSIAELLGQPGESLVWRVPEAVDNPVSQFLGALTQRFEEDGHHGGRDQ